MKDNDNSISSINSASDPEATWQITGDADETQKLEPVGIDETETLSTVDKEDTEETQTVGLELAGDKPGNSDQKISYHYGNARSEEARTEEINLKYTEHMINEAEAVDDEGFKNRRTKQKSRDIRRLLPIAAILVTLIAILAATGLFLRTEKKSTLYAIPETSSIFE